MHGVSPWGHKGLDMTGQLNNNSNYNFALKITFLPTLSPCGFCVADAIPLHNPNPNPNPNPLLGNPVMLGNTYDPDAAHEGT